MCLVYTQASQAPRQVYHCLSSSAPVCLMETSLPFHLNLPKRYIFHFALHGCKSSMKQLLLRLHTLSAQILVSAYFFYYLLVALSLSSSFCFCLSVELLLYSVYANFFLYKISICVLQMAPKTMPCSLHASAAFRLSCKICCKTNGV